MHYRNEEIIIFFEIYNSDVFFLQVKAKIQEYNKFGYDKLPLCMAKTSNSLTGDANVKGAPTGFKLDITDIFVSVGAGFVVPMVGEVSITDGPFFTYMRLLKLYYLTNANVYLNR